MIVMENEDSIVEIIIQLIKKKKKGDCVCNGPWIGLVDAIMPSRHCTFPWITEKLLWIQHFPYP